MEEQEKLDREDIAMIVCMFCFMFALVLFWLQVGKLSYLHIACFLSLPLLMLFHIMSPGSEYIVIHKSVIFGVCSVMMLMCSVFGLLGVSDSWVYVCFIVYVIWTWLYTLIMDVLATLMGIALIILITIFLF